ERPSEVGADRLVGAFAARRLCPDAAPLLEVAFGPAVTFDCVSGQAYLGGLIFPGPATALAALSREAAKLPRVNLDIRAQEPAPGRDTTTSIQHGLVFGFVCMVEGLSQRLKRQMPGPAKVLATGGFAASIARVSPVFDQVLPALLLEGLRRLYYEERDNL
ncbi:type III pantothenate kinase, partial [Muribaculaceae bacterium Isolate-002 (NCI)]